VNAAKRDIEWRHEYQRCAPFQKPHGLKLLVMGIDSRPIFHLKISESRNNVNEGFWLWTDELSAETELKE
jgi:hypothetical protein